MTVTARRAKGRPTIEARQEIEVAIARATLAVLRAHPAHEATIERIAATAGITKAAIYRRFPDRAALLSATITPIVEAWADDLTAIVADAPDALEALRRSFRAMAEDIGQEDRDLWYFVMASGPHDGSFSVDARRWRRRFEEIFDGLVTEAIAGGQILPGNPAAVREMLFFLLVEGPAHKVLTGRWAGWDAKDERATSFADRWAFALRGLTGTVAPD